MYQCISISYIDPEKKEILLEAARKLADSTRLEKGNLSYDILQPEGKDDIIILTERWESEEDFLAHVAHADEEGDRVFEFGKLVASVSTGAPDLYPCKVLY